MGTKSLWIEAKRHVLAVLRIQPAENLLAALIQVPTEAHEVAWRYYVQTEYHREQQEAMKPRAAGQPRQTTGAYSIAQIGSMPYATVKAKAIEAVMALERAGEVTQSDQYQDVLDAIAVDIRGRNRRRIQRQLEQETMQATLNTLAKKRAYLDEQAASYHKYIETAMGCVILFKSICDKNAHPCTFRTIQRKGKKRMVVPFTKHFWHLRDIKAAGQRAQFGSYKYSAQHLRDRGVLLSLDASLNPNARQFEHIAITISSDEIGIFQLDLTHQGNNIGSEELRMETLLQYQFENQTTICLFENVAKMNTNMLLFQLNKVCTSPCILSTKS